MGQWAGPTLKRLCERSFEPNAQLAADLVRRHIDDEDVSILDVDLCETEREITLHVPHYNGFMLDRLASSGQAWL
jgi:hypothetical protein